MTARVWIVDDEASICGALRKSLEREGFDVEVFSTAEAFLDEIQRRAFAPSVVFLDVRLPGISGIETLNRLQQSHTSLPVVIMTAFGDLQTAVDAVRGKSFEYLTKPFPLKTALSLAKRASHRAQRNAAGTDEAAKSSTSPLDWSGNLLGISPAMQRVYRQIAKVADDDWPVLIVGDQGGGKSSVARLLHDVSHRSQEPLLTFRPNPDDAAECQCELFGFQADVESVLPESHRQPHRSGVLQLAAGGTVVIDEVLMLPINLQTRLLEAIESKSFLPIGGSVPCPLKPRLLFTSTANITSEMDGVEVYPQLRTQLYLNVIELPPLRERIEDVPHLARAQLRQISPDQELSITDSAMSELQSRRWRGNLRELRQVIQAAAGRCAGHSIQIDDLSTEPSWDQKLAADENQWGLDQAVRRWVDGNCVSSPQSEPESPGDGFLYDECLEVVERALFESVLEATDGNRARAAELLGIHRTTLRQKSKRLGLE